MDDTLVCVPSMIIHENTVQGFMNDVARSEITDRIPSAAQILWVLFFKIRVVRFHIE